MPVKLPAEMQNRAGRETAKAAHARVPVQYRRGRELSCTFPNEIVLEPRTLYILRLDEMGFAWEFDIIHCIGNNTLAFYPQSSDTYQRGNLIDFIRPWTKPLLSLLTLLLLT